MTESLLHSLKVDLAERSYYIHIGAGLIEQAQWYSSIITSNQVMIVTDDAIAPLYLETIKAHFSDKQCDEVVLTSGEQNKNIASIEKIYQALHDNHHHRDSTIIALGGGVIGDMAGFAAASYQRGINFIQIPTTLLAQVDSSVGGKTGVNFLEVKNLIGAFYQPKVVISDINTLQSLPKRHYLAGIAEIIKHALIYDEVFFVWLEKHMDQIIAREASALTRAIYRSCEIKANVVKADEKEMGLRMLLNYGHTFAHGIEEAMGYGELLHGEAVAIGMLMAANLSARMKMINETVVTRIANLIQLVELPRQLPSSITAEKLMELIAMDKKNRGDSIRFVLLEDMGRAIVSEHVSIEQLKACIDWAYNC